MEGSKFCCVLSGLSFSSLRRSGAPGEFVVVIPFEKLVVRTSPTDKYLALPNAGWVRQIIPWNSDPADWPNLDEVKAQAWLSEAENDFVNCRMTRCCSDFLVFTRRENKNRVLLHVRREPGGKEAFPAVAKAAINGALWFSGGMMGKPAGDLDGTLSPAATLLLKARKELAGFLTGPQDVLALHHGGVGFTTFQAKSEYTLADGSIRHVELAAGKASATFQETCFLRVKPCVFDALERSWGHVGSDDFAAHLIVSEESWREVRRYCLGYLADFVDTFFCHANHLAD